MWGNEADRAVAALFDDESARYDGAHEGPGGRFLEARMAVVLEFVGDGPGDVLDAGMGPGRLLERFADRGWTVSGIDISARMVELAASRLPPARERLLQGDLADLPFEDGRFDAVVATGVIEYLDAPVAGLGELLRVLRPGGVVVVSMLNLDSLQTRWATAVWNPVVRVMKRVVPGFSRPVPHKKPGLLGRAELVQALRAAGAEPVAVRHVGTRVLPGPLARIAPRVDRRLAARLQASPGRWSNVFAPQLLIAARKLPTDHQTPTKAA